MKINKIFRKFCRIEIWVNFWPVQNIEKHVPLVCLQWFIFILYCFACWYAACVFIVLMVRNNNFNCTTWHVKCHKSIIFIWNLYYTYKTKFASVSDTFPTLQKNLEFRILRIPRLWNDNYNNNGDKFFSQAKLFHWFRGNVNRMGLQHNKMMCYLNRLTYIIL